MHGEHKKYLKSWLANALYREIFPNASYDDLRKFATVVLDVVDGTMRRLDSTGVEAYQGAFFDKACQTAVAQLKAFQNTPPALLDDTMARIIDLGPLMYVEHTILWINGITSTVRNQAASNAALGDALERLEAIRARAKQNGITSAELEDLKFQVHREWTKLVPKH